MCDNCALINSDRVIGGDEQLAIVLPQSAAPSVLVLTRRHGPLNEQPREVQEKMLSTATTLSSLIFDGLGVHGTNILIGDGEHCSYTIVGRTEGDGLDLRWKPTTTTPGALAETAKRIADETWYIGKEKATTSEETRASAAPPTLPSDLPPLRAENEAPRDVAAKISQPVRKGPKDATNYMIKQLTRKR